MKAIKFMDGGVFMKVYGKKQNEKKKDDKKVAADLWMNMKCW